MIFNITGGGGTALNFKVLAYATEEVLLAAAPTENTIGIITETPITSWIFSATEPSPAEAGMVWIFTGTSSSREFNALKKNGIQVYPLSAKQYVGGAWVDKTAKIWQGGAWVDWFFYLYTVGNVYEAVTGGYDSFINQGGGNATVGSDGMHMNTTFTSYYYPSTGLCTANKIDLTEYNTLVVKGNFVKNGDGGNFQVAVHTEKAPNFGDNIARTYYSTDGDFEIELDIGNAEGSYYLSVATMINRDQGVATPSATVTGIWLK